MSSELDTVVQKIINSSDSDASAAISAANGKDDADFVALLAIFLGRGLPSLTGLNLLSQKYKIPQQDIPQSLPKKTLYKFLNNLPDILHKHPKVASIFPNVVIIFARLKPEHILEPLLSIATAVPSFPLLNDFISLISERKFNKFVDYAFSCESKELLQPLISPLLRRSPVAVSDKLVDKFAESPEFEPVIISMLTSLHCPELSPSSLLKLTASLTKYASHRYLYSSYCYFIARTVTNLPNSPSFIQIISAIDKAIPNFKDNLYMQIKEPNEVVVSLFADQMSPEQLISVAPPSIRP